MLGTLNGYLDESWWWDVSHKSPDVMLSQNQHAAYFHIDPIQGSVGTAGMSLRYSCYNKCIPGCIDIMLSNSNCFIVANKHDLILSYITNHLLNSLSMYGMTIDK